MGCNGEQMTQNLLYNEVNPAVVSRIYSRKGRRWKKPHPYFYKLHKKKYGIFAWRSEEGIFKSFFKSPHVEILGSDGSVIRRIYCKSNDAAKKLHGELKTQLDGWVAASKKGQT